MIDTIITSCLVFESLLGNIQDIKKITIITLFIIIILKITTKLSIKILKVAIEIALKESGNDYTEESHNYQTLIQ